MFGKGCRLGDMNDEEKRCKNRKFGPESFRKGPRETSQGVGSIRVK